MDTELVVSHLKVEFGEDLRALHLFQHLINAWQWKTVLDCDVVELSVVDDWSTCAILLPYEEEGGCSWYVWWGLTN